MARRAVPLIIAAYLTLVFIDRFVLLELLVRRIGLALLLAVAAAAACIGAGFLARRGARGLAENFAVGYPIFGTICFLVGLVKISAWTMVPLLVIFGAAGVWSFLRGEPALPPVAPETEKKRDRLSTTALIIVLLCGFAFAQAPPASLDELSYHLAVPWTWVKEGRAIELPLLSHSYFPLGVESADLPFFATLGIDGGTASHFLHLLIAAATMALLFRGDMLLVAAIATAPVLAVTAGWSLVDWNLLAIALVLMRATDEDDRPTANAALAAGLLTKYTFIPLAVIIIGVALWKRRTALPWIGATAGSVFFIRNAIMTGDPFAPFFSRVAPHVTGYRAGAYLSDYVFDGRFLDESFGASLLSAAAATAGLTGVYLIAAGLLLFFLAPSARILVPFFALPASRASMAWKPARAFVAVAIVVQLFLLIYVVHRVDVMALISGDRSDEEYVAKTRPSYTTINAIDASVPPDARVFVVGLNETFWFRHRVRGGGNFDGPRVSAYLDTPTPEALRERLRADGITHVAVVSAPPPTTVEKKREERETVLTAEAQRNLALTLDRYATNVTQAGNAALFTLK